MDARLMIDGSPIEYTIRREQAARSRIGGGLPRVVYLVGRSAIGGDHPFNQRLYKDALALTTSYEALRARGAATRWPRKGTLPPIPRRAGSRERARVRPRMLHEEPSLHGVALIDMLPVELLQVIQFGALRGNPRAINTVGVSDVGAEASVRGPPGGPGRTDAAGLHLFRRARPPYRCSPIDCG